MREVTIKNRTGNGRVLLKLGYHCLLMGLIFAMLWNTGLGQLSDEEFKALQERGKAEGWSFTISKEAGGDFPDPHLMPAPEPTEEQLKNAIFDPCTPRGDLPDAFDWRDYGVCTPIRDMYYGGIFCASCWAFGVLAAMESQIAIHDGIHVDLSEQWLVSCTDAGDCGWWWGWYGHCYDYLVLDEDVDYCGDAGAVLEEDFPYRAENLPCECPYEHPYWLDGWAFVGDQYTIPPTENLKQAIYDHGPVASLIVWDSAFRYYSGGIFDECSPYNVNHTVTLVGWDDNQGPNGVWILRNELGTDWGEDGYMRILYECSSVGMGATYQMYSPQTGMSVLPLADFESEGPVGGPFDPSGITYLIKNLDSTGIDFSVSCDAEWITLSTSGGYIPPDDSVELLVTINAQANDLPVGEHQTIIDFVNETDHDGDTQREALLTVGMGIVYEWNMDEDPGWSAEGDWGFGQPTGQGGSEHGNPDPTSGHTGDNVYGYNLNGDYTNNMPETHLTSQAIDCRDITGAQLRFWRWLNVEQPAYDHAYLRISNDGNTWTELWSNDSEITDNQWQEFEFDISQYADNQQTVYLRWTMGPTDGSWLYSGWNIDDVRIYGIDNSPFVSIDMIPDDPPIEVPPGGQFTFTGILENNTVDQHTVDVWIMLDVPGYGIYGPLERFNSIEMLPYQTRTQPNIRQRIPGYAPLGDYEYIAYCGDYPGDVMDSSSFPFGVVQGRGGSNDNWALEGWFSKDDQSLPEVTALHSNYPNPFNPVTTISYDLAADSHVKLKVYNLMGEEVADLVDGYQTAGCKKLTWNAAEYASGVYFYSLNVGDQRFVKRMTLIK